MKNFLFISAALLIAACSNPKTEEKAAVEHLYKPSYADNFKIGDAKNSLLVEQMHKAIIAKNFDEAASFLADTVVFYLGDGSTLTGKPAVLDLMKKPLSQALMRCCRLFLPPYLSDRSPSGLGRLTI